MSVPRCVMSSARVDQWRPVTVSTQVYAHMDSVTCPLCDSVSLPVHEP